METLKSHYPLPKAQPRDLPFILLIVLALFSYTRPDILLPGGKILMYFPTLTLGILSILWLQSNRKVLSNKQTKYYIAFIILLAVSVPFSRNRYYAYLIVKSQVIFGLTTYLVSIAFIDDLKKFDMYLKVTLFGGLFLAILGSLRSGKLAISVLNDENDFALMLNFLIPLAYFLGQEAKNIGIKAIYYSAMGGLILANVVSLSRGGFVGLAAVLFYCWLVSENKLVGMLLALLILVSLVFFAPKSYWQEMGTITDKQDDTAVQRLYFWLIACREFADHPIMGVGPNNYGMWLISYIRPDDSYTTFVNEPARAWGFVCHSLYFTLLAENGILGIILFLNIVIGNIKDHKFIIKLQKSKNQLLTNLEEEERQFISQSIRKASFLSKAFCGALIAYFVTGAFITVLWYHYFWYLACWWVILSNAMRRMINNIDPGFKNV